jgi:hypothetical protein
MAKNEFPFPESIPSPETEHQDLRAEPLAVAAADMVERATPSLNGFQEMLARGEDRHYATHWGINE